MPLRKMAPPSGAAGLEPHDDGNADLEPHNDGNADLGPRNDGIQDLGRCNDGFQDLLGLELETERTEHDGKKPEPDAGIYDGLLSVVFDADDNGKKPEPDAGKLEADGDAGNRPWADMVDEHNMLATQTNDNAAGKSNKIRD